MKDENETDGLEPYHWKMPASLKRKLKDISVRERVPMSDLILNAVSSFYDKPGDWLTMHEKLDKILDCQSK